MAAAQGEMELVLRDTVSPPSKPLRQWKLSTGPCGRSIRNWLLGPLRLATVAAPRLDADYLLVAHTGGPYEENYLDAPPDDASPQGRTNKTVDLIGPDQA